MHIFFFILGFKDLVGLSGPVAEWNQLNTSAHTLKHLRPSLRQCFVCLSRTAVETRRSANTVVLKACASFVAEQFFFGKYQKSFTHLGNFQLCFN